MKTVHIPKSCILWLIYLQSKEEPVLSPWHLLPRKQNFWICVARVWIKYHRIMKPSTCTSRTCMSDPFSLEIKKLLWPIHPKARNLFFLPFFLSDVIVGVFVGDFVTCKNVFVQLIILGRYFQLHDVCFSLTKCQFFPVIFSYIRWLIIFKTNAVQSVSWMLNENTCNVCCPWDSLHNLECQHQ